ncbi:hypothetical protein Aperf_G00000098113 [Anoplocephala perfoliata]
MDQCGDTVIDLNDKIIRLEDAEMANGVLTSEQYMELLCLYLRFDRIMDAKFLWKRISREVKSAEPLLHKIWDLSVLLLKKQYSTFLSTCQELLKNPTLPPAISSHVLAIHQRVQCSIIDSIKSSFSCITIERLTSMLGLPQNEAVSLMGNWTTSSDGLYLTELAEVPQPLPGSDHNEMMSKFLRTLTEFSSFMENM